MLRITAFADRLIDDLDLLDWPESIKQMQRNWIGRSDGRQHRPARRRAARPDLPAIEVFTTRPDTLSRGHLPGPGPEHPLVADLAADGLAGGTPAAWRYPGSGDGVTDWTPTRALPPTRTWPSGCRTGSAPRPTTRPAYSPALRGQPGSPGEQLPIFVADYVLMGYGTGAIMAVPAHDQRDLDFARQFGLPCAAVLEPRRRTGSPATAIDPNCRRSCGLRRSPETASTSPGRGRPHRAEQARRHRGHHRMAGDDRRGRRRPVLPAARLAVLPAAVLGRAVPHRV